jgi:hypothetical protein
VFATWVVADAFELLLPAHDIKIATEIISTAGTR